MVCNLYGYIYIYSLVVFITDNYVDKNGDEIFGESGIFRRLTEEEREEFKCFMTFYKKGRKMDGFKLGDVGKRENVLYEIVVQTADNKFEGGYRLYGN
ncbi:hypothetical protein [Bacillus pseudomycoides]|uniref:hypothetical protein n=1 Tax=Bacillus pseudomycoides TaxID=64104 RepID=UPI000BF0F32F|nr:hypothetical protein [Bacillus pseudomycoides]PEM76679.1 hypothetical protein CN619_06285 [Bacillus pseudomycoides]